MAIVPRNREEIRINPLDLVENNKVAVGVTLPFNGYAVFNQSFTTKEQVKSNLINLLLTSPGERLMNPNFGIGIRDLLFQQIIDQDSLKGRIIDSAATYIPEIEILQVNAERVGETQIESYQLKISISYALLVNNNIDGIELNFI
tara:strand:+ start:1891 stop:2325 length:435 start_codon:yes stop_codon:yes gene_type:complete